MCAAVVSATTNAENAQAQAEEIEALESIYGDQWCSLDPDSDIASYMASFPGFELRLIFPSDYPSHRPPIYEIDARWQSRPEADEIVAALNSIADQADGEVVVFEWLEWLRNFLENYHAQTTLATLELETTINDKAVASAVAAAADEDVVVAVAARATAKTYSVPASVASISSSTDASVLAVPEILQGEPITDRKSTFQGFAAVVRSTQEVRLVMTALLSNKKIARAAHNMMVYRIHDSNRGIFLTDNDEDGEHGAGARLAHLMQILDVRNVMVVVTRWYGGIHLGPDRWKHISNAARLVLATHNLIPKDGNGSCGGGGGGGGSGKAKTRAGKGSK